MKRLFYSEDPEVCTYPNGCRFEWCELLIDRNLNFWIKGKGFYGCLTKIEITEMQAMKWINKKNIEILNKEIFLNI